MNTDESLAQLVEALDRDLELVEVLRYRLIVLGALVGADQSPSLPRAIRELGQANEELRIAELFRTSATARLAEELDLGSTSRVDLLARHAQGEWNEILLDRRRSLTEAVIGVRALAGSVSAVMGRQAVLIEDALSSLRPDAHATYGRLVPRHAVLVEGAL